MPHPLLEGTIHDPGDEDESAMQRIRKLEADLRTSRNEADQARNDADTSRAAIVALRKQLLPLHRALKAVFGEINIAVGDEPSHPNGQPQAATPQSGKTSPVWEEWKTQLGGTCAKIITALQTHTSADVNQLVVLTKTTRKQSIYDAIHRLNKSGLIDKRDNKISLKQL